MRNVKYRPISWSICEARQIKRSIIKGGFFAESLFIRLIVSADNWGILPANKFLLKGLLYPIQEEVKPEDVENALKILQDEGLIILYDTPKGNFLFIPKMREHSKITGNMTDRSEHPLPSKEKIDEWCRRFNEVYTPFIQRIYNVYTENKNKNKDNDKDRNNIYNNNIYNNNNNIYNNIYDSSVKSEKSDLTTSQQKYFQKVKDFFNNPPSDWFKELQEDYPAIDLKNEFRRMKAWLISHYPSKIKKNFKRFVVNWLNKEVDYGRAKRISAEAGGKIQKFAGIEKEV